MQKPARQTKLFLEAALALLAAGAREVAAQTSPPSTAYPRLSLLDVVWAFLGLLAIWLILYKVLYPFCLRHYRPDFCKSLFWTLFALYGLTWFYFSSYVFFGWDLVFTWKEWAALVLCGLWVISFLATILRRNPT